MKMTLKLRRDTKRFNWVDIWIDGQHAGVLCLRRHELCPFRDLLIFGIESGCATLAFEGERWPQSEKVDRIDVEQAEGQRAFRK